MVFAKYGLSLYDFLKENNYGAFPMYQIQHIASQLFRSVAFMHEHQLIHTDLKPENVLFVNSDYYLTKGSKYKRKIVKDSRVVLIDFGSATFNSQHHTRVVSTRHYRSPEVILNLGWSYPTDIWSLGCILIELHTGNALFQTHDNKEHLCMMEKVLGPVPDTLVQRVGSTRSEKYFSFRGDKGKLMWKPSTSDERRHMRRVVPLKDLLIHEKHDLFYDLLKKTLSYDPDTRITASQALQHPFFKENFKKPVLIDNGYIDVNGTNNKDDTVYSHR